MSARDRLAAIAEAAAELPDEELLELHRQVSRLATRARQQDPEFQACQRAGLRAARAKVRAALDIASREERGQ